LIFLELNSSGRGLELMVSIREAEADAGEGGNDSAGEVAGGASAAPPWLAGGGGSVAG